ncbi:hypothetical protein NA56DRAFT_711544 [Hyaloscypha hepaticicola]|uniref:Uncharacterized protein n=1 Tax=Hyaloscypha hepaticicola TaxID=2082293 RepID=A0A2J6PIP2_9HELO|nr:hypothetical protein NA56DRAFT_711544 [Hyaloscypha hepaticicola]
MAMGVNPGRLPSFSDEHRARVIGYSDTRLLSTTPQEEITAYHNFGTEFAHIQNNNEHLRLAHAEINKAPFRFQDACQGLVCSAELSQMHVPAVL